MDSIQTYYLFAIPIIVGVIAQIIKFILFTMKHGWKPEYALTHGHMPSTHTAIVISLLTTVGYYEGVHTGTFAVSAVLAFLIIDDAARVRMILGDQGRYFNMLIDQLKNEIDEEKFPRLKERVGHRTSEVIGGAIIGFFLTLLFITALA